MRSRIAVAAQSSISLGRGRNRIAKLSTAFVRQGDRRRRSARALRRSCRLYRFFEPTGKNSLSPRAQPTLFCCAIKAMNRVADDQFFMLAIRRQQSFVVPSCGLDDLSGGKAIENPGHSGHALCAAYFRCFAARTESVTTASYADIAASAASVIENTARNRVSDVISDGATSYASTTRAAA